MPQYAQAKRNVSGHIIGRESDIERDEIVDWSEVDSEQSPGAHPHFHDRGEHDEAPPPLTEPGSVVDPTAYSDEEAEYVDDYEGPGINTVDAEPVSYDQPEDFGGEGPSEEERAMTPDQSANPLDVIDGVGEARSEDIRADLEVGNVGEFADMDPEDVPEQYETFHERARDLVDTTYED